MRRIVLGALGVVGIAVAGAASLGDAFEEAPPDVFPEVSLDALKPGDWVRVTGTAHYGSVLKQKLPGGLWRDDRQLYLFGLFPENDTSDREIPVLVLTARAPERLVTFETMTLEGRVRVPDRGTVPPNTEALLSSRTEYFLADGVLVLEPVRIHSEDGVWEEPK